MRKKCKIAGHDLSRKFGEWLALHDIASRTAYDLMRDAGFTEEERTERREKDAKRKRVERERRDNRQVHHRLNSGP